MSGFLGRVAARALGAAPAAEPRVPGVFEGGAREGGVLEVLDETIATAARAGQEPAPAPPPAPRGAAPPASPGRPESPAARGEFVFQQHKVAPAAVAAAAPPDPGEPEPRATADPRPQPAAAAEREDFVFQKHKVLPPAVPAVSAVPAGAAAPAAPPTAPPAAAPAHEEPPPVRVHIGRLEVRANLPQPVPQEQRREQPARPEGLSLADYLRGKREARA